MTFYGIIKLNAWIIHWLGGGEIESNCVEWVGGGTCGGDKRREVCASKLPSIRQQQRIRHNVYSKYIHFYFAHKHNCQLSNAIMYLHSVLRASNKNKTKSTRSKQAFIACSTPFRSTISLSSSLWLLFYYTLHTYKMAKLTVIKIINKYTLSKNEIEWWWRRRR